MFGSGAKPEPSQPYKLTYFQVMAKGLGPALVLELSGLPWIGPRDTGFTAAKWDSELKSSGKCPFGQLPLLEADGMNIGQSIAIVNYVGKKAGTEGSNDTEFVVSQMLLAEAEDLYNAMQKVQPSVVAKFGDIARDGFSSKGGKEACMKFWRDWVPNQLSKIEGLIKQDTNKFTSTGLTVGEIYLWSMLHQMKLVRPDVFASTPHLEAFYKDLLENPSVQKVLKGGSAFGTFKQYFIMPPEGSDEANECMLM